MLNVLKYLLGYLPWIAFGAVGTAGDSRWGALAGLGIAILLVIWARAVSKSPWDALWIETSSAIFLVLLTAAAFTVNPAPLGDYGATVSIGWLAVTAWGSLAVRHPFTLGIARTMTPPELQRTPVFYRVNAVITSVWAIGFTIVAILSAVLQAAAPDATTASLVIKILGFAVPAVFTNRYPKVVQKRYASQMAAMGMTR